MWFKLGIFLTAVALFSQISAFEIGKKGKSFTHDNVLWQPVEYVDKDVGFKASIPGVPNSGLANEFVYSGSVYDGVTYEVHSNLKTRFAPPTKKSDFLILLKQSFPKDVEVVLIPTTKKNVLYLAEIRFSKEEKLARIYCSKNQLYWAIVQGDDFSLAPYFFDSVQITK